MLTKKNYTFVVAIADIGKKKTDKPFIRESFRF